jgi:hypothetical protein
MKSITFWLSIAASLTGLVAVIYWGRSAVIDQRFIPGPPVGDVREDPNVLPGYLEDIYWYLVGVSDTLSRVAHLNRIAAVFTGASVLLSGIVALVSGWPSN